jgi:vancomycin resistance protein YoaR
MLNINKKDSQLIVLSSAILGVFYLGIIFYSSIQDHINVSKEDIRRFASVLHLVSNDDFDLILDDNVETIDSLIIKGWIEPYVRNYSGKEDLRLSATKIKTYLEALAPHIAIEPINAKIKFEDNEARLLEPAIEGKRINIKLSAINISRAILSGQTSAEIIFDVVEPEITLEKINNLGINTLLGSGSSNFWGSPDSRVHNIKLGTVKYNGLILMPGEEFSFNKFLGKVDEKSGYLSELVIKKGELVKEFGGGLCQVSTTIFRAAINTGLPITERMPHSFPVRYYAPQGFDSTIYPGVVDLKFVNDTPKHLLIQGIVESSRLTFEIYGSNDGRNVIVEEPVHYNFQQNGAMSAYFMRKISYSDGTEVERKFESHYKPPVKYESNPLE